MAEQDFIKAGFTVVGTENNENKLLRFLKENYPNVIRDTEINLEELKTVLGLPIDEKINGYGLNFVGRNFARAKYAQKTEKELRLNSTLSKNIDTTENLVLKGDNLNSLKILKNHYSGQVKCIYIDPPYNTEKDEFVYPDRFDKEEAEVLGLANLSESDFARMDFSFKTKRSHNGWLAFMYPRLLLARDLLSKEGVIFISIDDNEQANLKLLCDEVFGEENFQTVLNIQVRYADKSLNEEKPFKPLLEYILVYSKSNLFIPNRPIEEYTTDKFIFEIEEIGEGSEFNVGNQLVKVFKKGQWKITKHETGNILRLKETWITGSIYSTMSYGKVFQKVVEPRISQDGLGCLYKVIGRGEDGLGYRYYTGPQKANATKGKMYSGMPLDRVEEMKSEQGAIRLTPIPTYYDYSADFGNIRHEGGVGFNSGKKPIRMIKQLLEWAVLTEKNATILDFFAGSGSTGHAVMDLNADDGGNRKFILCQIDEPIKEDKSDYKFCIENNLPPVISSITIERLKRAGQKIANDIETENSKTGLFDKDKKQVPDIGFKVFDSVEAPKLKVDDKGQISITENETDALSRIYNMIFTVGLDEPTQVPEEVVKDCIYKIGNHFYITNSEKITSDDYSNAIKNGKVFIDGWTASLNGTLQNYKEDVKIVF
ncbi:MAG: site-specific DNA-methyltransferase [Bacteroidetes bacterium]|nr:site-specific DNA-methyltransferase [Bacteroidota bacterium]